MEKDPPKMVIRRRLIVVNEVQVTNGHDVEEWQT